MGFAQVGPWGAEAIIASTVTLDKHFAMPISDRDRGNYVWRRYNTHPAAASHVRRSIR